MARTHFAIEKPRKISISIQGYDAQARTQAQQKKQMERSRRQKRKQKPDSAPVKPAVSPQPPASSPQLAAPPVDQVQCDNDDEIEALAAAASSTAISRKAQQDLQQAFGHPGDKNANE